MFNRNIRMTNSTPRLTAGTSAYAMAQSQKVTRNKSTPEHVTVDVETQTRPLDLVYKSVIDNLNSLFETDLSKITLPGITYLNNSPAATAGHIVSTSTTFFPLFKQQQPQEDLALNTFLDLTTRGIERGFQEAREILTGLHVLHGKTAEDIDAAYGLVQQGLAYFQSR